MRVSTSLVTHDTISRLMDSSRRMAEAQMRATTGKRVGKMSDDPSDATNAMHASGSLRGLAQYRRNIDAIGSRLDAEEVSLDHLTSIMTRAREVAVGQVGSNASAATRTAAAAEIRQLLEQAGQIGNTTFGDGYLFGGASAASAASPAPFDVDQLTEVPHFVRIVAPATVPVAPQGTYAVEIGPGETMRGPHDGDTVFLQTGVLQSLHDLHAALLADSDAAIGAASTGLVAAFDEVQALIGDIGARQNQVQLLSASYDALTLNLEERRGNLTELDAEQAITEMLTRQTAYQAAMLASSKVMGMSLTDYLR